VRGCTVESNASYGIHVFGHGNRIESNLARSNSTGFRVDGVSNVGVLNYANGNSDNYNVTASNHFEEIATTAGTPNPWGNLSSN
jgi:hypothetical protein